MKWKDQIHNLQAYQPGKSIDEVKNAQLNPIIKLASNENPYGYSSNVDEVLKQYDHFNFSLYPDASAAKLRESVSSLLGVNKKQLIFTNGTDELIQIISRALLEHGKNTVMATPTFSQYKHNAIIEGGEVREVPLKNGKHDLNQMLAEIDINTAVVWICNPNNPTGTYIPNNQLLSFLKNAPKDVLIVLDEAYIEYVNQSYHSLDFIKDFPNLLIMRTFSKIYGLASFRIGYGISSEAIIQKLEPLRLPFNTNVLGQTAAAAAVKDQKFVQKCQKRNAEEREKYYTFCLENQLEYFPSETNFILIDFKCDSDEVTKFLLSKGLIVRSGRLLGFPTCVRITIGLKEQNEKVRTAIKEFIHEGS